jgi:hypothetical protein
LDFAPITGTGAERFMGILQRRFSLEMVIKELRLPVSICCFGQRLFGKYIENSSILDDKTYT